MCRRLVSMAALGALLLSYALHHECPTPNLPLRLVGTLMLCWLALGGHREHFLRKPVDSDTMSSCKTETRPMQGSCLRFMVQRPALAAVLCALLGHQFIRDACLRLDPHITAPHLVDPLRLTVGLAILGLVSLCCTPSD